MTDNVSIQFPDELDIILHTSVPFLGKFYYDPNMSIRNEKLITQKQLIFNPLIKLNLNSLNNIPDYEQRVSHFFNRASYESMVYNYSAMQSLKISKNELGKKEKILQYNDNKNNNLTFVLDTIFESGQTLYLGGKPFTILFYKVKSRKTRITNKIEDISGDPNQTIFETRDKLRKKGKENQLLLQKLQNDNIDNIDDVIDTATSEGTNIFNNIKSTLKSTQKNIMDKISQKDDKKKGDEQVNININISKGGGRYNHSIIVDNDFESTFKINDNDFLHSFSKFISIQINNFNAENINPIVYFNKGIWHGIENISTSKSIRNILRSVKENSLDNISNILSNIGVHLMINNENNNNIAKSKDIQLILHFDLNYNTKILTFKENHNINITGGSVFDKKQIPNNRYFYNDIMRRKENYGNSSNYNPYLSPDDFEETSLNKYEIEIFVELSNKKISKNDIDCLTRKRKMIYNAKELFSSEKIFDFTSLSNMDLYEEDIDLSKIRPYLDLAYNRNENIE